MNFYVLMFALPTLRLLNSLLEAANGRDRVSFSFFLSGTKARRMLQRFWTPGRCQRGAVADQYGRLNVDNLKGRLFDGNNS